MNMKYWWRGSELTITKGTSSEILARISKDGTITEGTSSRITARISEDGTIKEGTGSKIIARISQDGTVTEGTSSRIIACISDNGTITEGTGSRIIGRIHEEPRRRGPSLGPTVIIAACFGLFCLYFSIFELPRVLQWSFVDMSDRGNTVGVLTLGITLFVTIISCLLVNVYTSKKGESFKERVMQCYFGTAVCCYLAIVIESCLTGEIGFFIVLAGMLFAALAAVIPTLLLCPIFHLIHLIPSIIEENKRES